MMRFVALIALLAFAPLMPANADRVITYGDEDVAMNGAIAEAQGTLDVFLAEMESPSEGAYDFMLKIGVETNEGGLEHIWVADLTRNGESEFDAFFANQPDGFDANVGDAVSFDAGQISDWSYTQNGLLHGNYTTRVMLPDMNPDYAARLSAMLAPLPEGTP